MEIAILTQINLCLNSAAMTVAVLPAAVNCHTHKLIKLNIWLPVRRLAFIINTQTLQLPLDQYLGSLPQSTVTVHHSDLHTGYSH